jgi:hypothetical protein
VFMGAVVRVGGHASDVVDTAVVLQM